MASFVRRYQMALLRALAVLFSVLLIYSIASMVQYENVFSRGYDYDQLPEAPASSIGFYRQFFDYLETPLALCQKLAVFSKTSSWDEPTLCLSEPMNMLHVSDCLVYAFHDTDGGGAGYASFERGVAEYLGCEVHVFDMTGQRRETTSDDVGSGSVTWHVLGGPGDRQHFASLVDIVERLGHSERVIHHLRLAIDLDPRRAGRLPPFLRELQQLLGGELELLARQVAQLQLALALRPAALRADTLASYQRGWQLLDQLHRRGFSVLRSEAAGRVIWLPGLGRQVGSSYNLLLAKHMPLHRRRSAQLAQLEYGGNSSLQTQQHVQTLTWPVAPENGRHTGH